MPEAWGQVVMRFDHSLDDVLAVSSDALSWEDTMDLCRRAGVSPREHDAFSSQVDEGSEFYFEGEPTRIADRYWLVNSFGDEWMYLLQALMLSQSKLELYGRIQHEHGVIEYYALCGNGQRYFGTIDAECSACSEDAEDIVIEKWLAATPPQVKEQLPDLFAIEAAISDESPEEIRSSEPWMPIENEDFVRRSDGGALLINESLLSDNQSYCFDHLRRAKELGAVLIDPHIKGSSRVPFCTLHYVIDNLEIESERKTQIVSDLLTLFEFDIDSICRGYGDRWGTALFLAAGEGLTKVVDLLLARGADPTKTEGNYAQQSPLQSVKTSIVANQFEEPMEEEGEYLDFQAVYARLQTLVGTSAEQPRAVVADGAAPELRSRHYGGRIRCPKCNWAATGKPDWQCSCGHEWDTFQTRAKCPACEKQWKNTDCPKCFETSRHIAWYREA